jgi:tyrosyl-tRNA synthetase
MDFLEELQWRGMLQDFTPGIEEVLKKEKVTAYIGFDPTATSLTIGNYVQIMILKLFQLSGHQPLVLMGGATGRIGDPSGKDKERVLKSEDELEKNLERQTKQFMKLLDFEQADNKAIMVNNFEFYRDMNILEFLRTVGKTLTVNYMLSKESVQNRLESGISFTEFSYQLLQAYDFQVLFQKYKCILQMGGSDQWGNITSGTEFIRRNLGEKAYAITTPLLTKSNGKKFGKSEEGNIWLDPEMTSPYKFYQFWINTDDADLKSFFRYFSLKSKPEIESLESNYIDNPRKLKEILAEELTVRIHGTDTYVGVLKVSELLFGQLAIEALSANQLALVMDEIPTYRIDRSQLATGIPLGQLLTQQTGILTSIGEVRRAVQGNAITINKKKVTDLNFTLDSTQLLYERYVLVENGKKNKYLLVFLDEI